MSRIIECLMNHMAEWCGYRNVCFVEQTEEFLYFSVLDFNNSEMQIKVQIDDERTFEDWQVYESEDGYIWQFVK